jgi:hypothetical protein
MLSDSVGNLDMDKSADGTLGDTENIAPSLNNIDPRPMVEQHQM